MEKVDLNIIIPAAGLGSRFASYGFTKNKFLLPIDVELTKMIEKAIITLTMKAKNMRIKFIFILREEEKNLDVHNLLNDVCSKSNSECIIHSINYVTEGPASTAYIVKDIIDDNTPLIISNSDQILDWNFQNFFDYCSNYDAAVLTYTPDYELIIGEKDKHSFVRFDDLGKPIEFVEKTIISKEALVGVHYYKTGKLFIKSYEYLFDNNIRAPNGEFYLSYTYQALLNLQYNIGTYKLKTGDNFYPVGEPIDYFNYYNKQSPIIKHRLKDLDGIRAVNKYDNMFSFKFAKLNDKIFINNKLFILLSGTTTANCDIFVSGLNKEVVFLEDSYYILITLTKSSTFFEVDYKNYTRGWLIGDFEPCIERQKQIEVGYLFHEKNSFWNYHYHKESIEINYLLKGKMVINNEEYNETDIFVMKKNVISCPLFLEDCMVICIKLPAVPKDKYII